MGTKQFSLSLKDQAIMLLNEHPEREDEIIDDSQNQENPESIQPANLAPETGDETGKDVSTPIETVSETASPSDHPPEPKAPEEASGDIPDPDVPAEAPVVVAEEHEATASGKESAEVHSPVNAEQSAPAEQGDESADGSDSDDADFVGHQDDSDEETLAVAPEDHLDILASIDGLLANQEPGFHLLEKAKIPSLIQLVNWMAYDRAHLDQHTGRVNLVRQAFDALKAADTMDHGMESDFRGAFATFARQRSKQQQSRTGIKTENARKKRDLIVRLRDIVEQKNPDLIVEVRHLQDLWKTIGQVPQDDLETLYREYRGLLDEFYELRGVHLELMEYDRKKNLEERERLIEVAKSLIPAEEDRENPDVWKDKLDLLQELQQEWKASGHVPREDMDRINEAYRTAIDAFFEVRTAFREVEDRLREESASKKAAILENLEIFRVFSGESPKEWNDATQAVRALQESWKALGPAPSKLNGELWGKYRDVCNTFFSHKSAFFKQLDDQRNENLELKKALVEQAEGLSQRTDWEQAAKELKDIQTNWKTIGPIPDRHSQKLWNRFRAACDGFFEARRQHYQALHSEEKDNLAVRKALIEEVKALQSAELGRNDIVEAIKVLQERWRESGRVPYKEKEKIWQEFRGEIDKVFTALDARKPEPRQGGEGRRSEGRRGDREPRRNDQRRDRPAVRLDQIEDGDERVQAIQGNIARIRRKMAISEEKVEQYSTNIQFIARGKSGDALRAQIQGEIDKEGKLILEMKKEIRSLENLMNNPPPAAEPTPPPAATTTEEAAAPASESAPVAEATEAEAPAVVEAVAEAAPTQEEDSSDEVADASTEDPASEAVPEEETSGKS